MELWHPQFCEDCGSNTGPWYSDGDAIICWDCLREIGDRRERVAAKAMSARQSHDPQGHGPKDASAVGVADLPDSTPETPQVQP